MHANLDFIHKKKPALCEKWQVSKKVHPIDQSEKMVSWLPSWVALGTLLLLIGAAIAQQTVQKLVSWAKFKIYSVYQMVTIQWLFSILSLPPKSLSDIKKMLH